VSGPGDEGSPGETLLTDPAEVLYRQVHPNFIAEGQPTAQAFRPFPRDEGEVSIARGALTTAAAAFAHYTEVLRFASAGTWAVTVGEAALHGLACYDQPRDDTPAHGFIDFRMLKPANIRASSNLLLLDALARGRVYPAP
jgi:hypothetical protein